MDKRYQVFVSSTFSDLKDERSKVMRTIMSMDCIPAGMELFPAMDEEQLEFIKRIIDDCDYYLLIIGGRYGSVNEEGISYTEKEYDYAVQKGIPVLAFLHEDINAIPLGKSEVDSTKRELLLHFREKVAKGRLVQFWSNADDLNGKVAVSLSQTIKQHPAVGWVRANLQTSAESLQEENKLRRELAELKSYVSGLEAKVTQDVQMNDLASLDDEITLHVIRKRWSPSVRHDIMDSYEATITWGELFGKLAPQMMDNPNEENAKRILGGIFHSYLDLGSGASYLERDDFDTVKIQFIALKLIDVVYSKTTKGTMALFWCLTPQGKEYMIQRRVVRKQ
ncbi:MAG: DUF4062 domain-containing protein [Paludibacteraceae bacterium]|nr:DUF4062 domain-containing protein [Paludibacteraceae bacterium]